MTTETTFQGAGASAISGQHRRQRIYDV